MRKLSVSAAIAAVTIVGAAATTSMQPAQAQQQLCHDEVRQEGAPIPEDNCDVVGDPDEGGSEGGTAFGPPPPPPPPPPPRVD